MSLARAPAWRSGRVTTIERASSRLTDRSRGEGGEDLVGAVLAQHLRDLQAERFRILCLAGGLRTSDPLCVGRGDHASQAQSFAPDFGIGAQGDTAIAAQ